MFDATKRATCFRTEAGEGLSVPYLATLSLAGATMSMFKNVRTPRLPSLYFDSNMLSDLPMMIAVPAFRIVNTPFLVWCDTADPASTAQHDWKRARMEWLFRYLHANAACPRGCGRPWPVCGGSSFCLSLPKCGKIKFLRFLIVRLGGQERDAGCLQAPGCIRRRSCHRSFACLRG
jgi:hypothetical protein